MNTNDNVKNFLIDLKALLAKYNADIWVSGDAEASGSSAEICIDINNETILRSYDCIGSNDIKIKN